MTSIRVWFEDLSVNAIECIPWRYYRPKYQAWYNLFLGINMSKMFCSKNGIFLISKSNLYKLSQAEPIGGFISFKHHFAPIYFIMSWFWHEVSSNFQTNFKIASLQIQVLCLSLSSKCFCYFLAQKLNVWNSDWEIRKINIYKKQMSVHRWLVVNDNVQSPDGTGEYCPIRFFLVNSFDILPKSLSPTSDVSYQLYTINYQYF